MNVWSTARFMLLIARVKLPLKVIPAGKFNATVALSVPAMPPFSSRNRPVPFVTLTTVPSESETFEAATVSFFSPVGSETDSMAKLPTKVWPATVSERLLPSMRKNGPAGRTTLNATPPALKDWFTGAAVLLMLSLSAPLNCTLPKLMPAVRLIWPAMPAGVMTNPAVGIVSAIPPRFRLTLVIASVTTREPSDLVTCSNATLPLSVCSAIVMAMFDPSKRR